MSSLRTHLEAALEAARAEMGAITEDKRQKPEALLKWQELRDMERRLTVMLKQAENLDEPWPTTHPKIRESWSV